MEQREGGTAASLSFSGYRAAGWLWVHVCYRSAAHDLQMGDTPWCSSTVFPHIYSTMWRATKRAGWSGWSFSSWAWLYTVPQMLGKSSSLPSLGNSPRGLWCCRGGGRLQHPPPLQPPPGVMRQSDWIVKVGDHWDIFDMPPNPAGESRHSTQQYLVASGSILCTYRPIFLFVGRRERS